MLMSGFVRTIVEDVSVVALLIIVPSACWFQCGRGIRRGG